MIVAGFGYRTGADQTSLRSALMLAQAGHPSVTALTAPADKAALLTPLAEALAVPLIAVSPGQLSAVATTTQSPASLTARHTGSVAEASALAAAGEGARLVAHRHISTDRMATCAIAEGFSA